MRLQHVQQSRPDWYDRNGASLAFNYSAGVLAPHADTVRWTYTVPSGKKLMVQTLQSSILRSGAAGVVDYAYVVCGLTPSGGARKNISGVGQFSNSLGVLAIASLGSTMVMVAGDAIDGSTGDSSTGGTQNVLTAMSGLLFDA